MSSVNSEQNVQPQEDMGYDVPFVSYTWGHWQEMQARTLLSFTRFQRAIEQRHFQLALSIVEEIQEVSIAMQKEVGMWIGEPHR